MKALLISFVIKHYIPEGLKISIQRWKHKKKLEPWGGFIFWGKMEQNRDYFMGFHGISWDKNEDPTFCFVAHSVFI